MAVVHHSKDFIITRAKLREIAEARLTEAERLYEQEHYACAMFLGGCALECYLKLATCCTLRLDGLPSAFKTHMLEALILYSGFQQDLQGKSTLKAAFDQIVEEWGVDGRQNLLYGSPSQFDRERAARFLTNLRDPRNGVLSWLKNLLS